MKKPALGSDSEDEKRMSKAEARAVKRLKAHVPQHSVHSFSAPRVSMRAETVTAPGPPAQQTYVGPVYPSRPMAWGLERRPLLWPCPARASTTATCTF